MTSRKVLVVDDDPVMARLVRKILADNGFHSVAQAATGREALELLEGVDVVLLDHQLPDTTGLEVLEAVRTRPQPPAVILVTAHGNESLAATALRRGADDYLAKDVSLAELLPQVLERVRRTRELRKALVAAERDLVRAERLAAIGEMTVTLHHEVNNPLMAAFAHVELLLADPAMSAESRQETLASVREALHRIRDIMRRVGDLREVRTKSYATGVQMVDLADAGAASSIRRGRALVLVTDEDLARVVSLLLKHAGFEVQRASDGAELERQAAGGQARLVVAQGGTDAAGAHPLGGFAPPADRSYRVVALVAGDGTGAVAAGADHVVELPFDPGTFTAEVIELTGGA
ncbi:MAG TPA: response regulator [Gemmatimonadales bacterium]|nr:response regulator [Gemmatimonadales bacterium]